MKKKNTLERVLAIITLLFATAFICIAICCIDMIISPYWYIILGMIIFGIIGFKIALHVDPSLITDIVYRAEDINYYDIDIQNFCEDDITIRVYEKD